MRIVNKRIVTGIVMGLFVSASMTACTLAESPFNNALSQEDDQKAKQTEIVERDPFAPAEAEKKNVASSHIREMGEDVSEIDVQNGNVIPDALVYTVNRAEQFDDYVQAGISEDAMNPFVEYELLDEDGNIKASVKFIVIEMTVKNNCAELDRNITSFRLRCADSAQNISDETTEIDFFDIPNPSYFSNPGGEKVGDEWMEYYHYSLPVGQSKDLKVGWYVDVDKYDLSKLYLVFNYDEDERLVKIEL